MTPETILNAAVGVLAERGRCFGNYEYAGEVCVMGALAVAAGKKPAYWLELQEAAASAVAQSLDTIDHALIAAAYRLAAVVVPPLGEISVEDLCVLIGHWHDGERHLGDVRPKNSEVRDALILASLSSPAEQIGASA
ncbi:hypothetical protein AB0J28_09565 [Streptosporangium canum]|uniref:DUF6197 family protein n=1 Tax=Streptosporangium canum TaxID=324952 RepID=UPI003440827B